MGPLEAFLASCGNFREFLSLEAVEIPQSSKPKGTTGRLAGLAQLFSRVRASGPGHA
jgi:hypothetical protein